MPRYHLHIRCQSGLTKDLEGAEYPDFDSAHQDALFSAKQMLAEAVRFGAPLDVALGRSIEITDSEGEIAASLPLADCAAVDMRGVKRSDAPGLDRLAFTKDGLYKAYPWL